MGERLYVGTRKGLFELERRSGAWSIGRVSFLGDPVDIVRPDARTGRVWAALGLGHFGVKLHTAEVGSDAWEELPAPAFPPKPEGLEDRDGMGREVEWRVDRVWALETGGADRPEVLWCGTIPGGLFRSEDAGKSWSLVRSLWDREERQRWFGGGADAPGIHSICVDPRDPKRVALGISCGGVWLTEDEGESWANRAEGMRAAFMPPEQAGDPNIQDPHCVVQCPAQPDVYWAQHHNGIFRSTDDLRSWHEITDVSPSTFGFAVAVHPEDADTAWFVPAIKDEKRVPVDGKVVVTRTRDGGKSFDVLREGLPQTHAYDLTYRHALDIDETGERLAFGSTTGALWVTDDGGDRWELVSAHLPPVYCVRFLR